MRETGIELMDPVADLAVREIYERARMDCEPTGAPRFSPRHLTLAPQTIVPPQEDLAAVFPSRAGYY